MTRNIESENPAMVSGEASATLSATSSAPAPPRLPNSIRRTSTLDADWPGGMDGSMRLIGRARDAVTLAAGSGPIVLAEDAFEAELGPDRIIHAIRAEPERPALARMVGIRGGGHLRAALAESVPKERQRASPLYLLLDDIAGTSLVAPWALSHWSNAWLERRAEVVRHYNFTDICIGFREGSKALGLVRERDNLGAPTSDLRHPDDPESWHRFEPHATASLRRARWIDVWWTDRIYVEAGFQDSANTPDGGRQAVHEYLLSATVDPESLRILTLDPQPQVLPYADCRAALDTSSRLIGLVVSELREAVPVRLRGPLGCTHLNDAFRALAEVPALAEQLQTHHPSAQQPGS